MKRIFLDVGANTGQTLAAVLDPIFRFDEIVCFEPARACWDKLRSLAEDDHAQRERHRVRVMRFGLWNKTCAQNLFEPGIKGASLWRKDKARTDASEPCQVVRATDWFKKHIQSNDIVYLKLNCEGAECDILDDLLDSGEFDKVSYAMIDFDVRKIASQKHREAEVRERIKGFGFPRVATSKEVMVGPTHAARIKNWLRLVEEAQQ